MNKLLCPNELVVLRWLTRSLTHSQWYKTTYPCNNSTAKSLAFSGRWFFSSSKCSSLKPPWFCAMLSIILIPSLWSYHCTGGRVNRNWMFVVKDFLRSPTYLPLACLSPLPDSPQHFKAAFPNILLGHPPCRTIRLGGFYCRFHKNSANSPLQHDSKN